MSQKTKSITLIIIIVLAIIGFGLYFIKKNKTNVPTPQAVNLLQQNKQPIENISVVQSQSQQPNIAKEPINGIVSAIAKDSIEITTSEIKKTFPLVDSIVVYKAMINSTASPKMERKTIMDIKKDDKVSVTLNSDNSSIFAIFIAGNATK